MIEAFLEAHPEFSKKLVGEEIRKIAEHKVIESAGAGGGGGERSRRPTRSPSTPPWFPTRP